MIHVSQRKEQLCGSHQFTDRETEAQGGEAIYPASPIQYLQTEACKSLPSTHPVLPSCRWVNRGTKVPSLPKVPEEHSQPSFTPLAPPHAALLGKFSHREETAAAVFTSGWPKPQSQFRFANSVWFQPPARPPSCRSHSPRRLAAPQYVCEI